MPSGERDRGCSRAAIDPGVCLAAVSQGSFPNQHRGLHPRPPVHLPPRGHPNPRAPDARRKRQSGRPPCSAFRHTRLRLRPQAWVPHRSRFNTTGAVNVRRSPDERRNARVSFSRIDRDQARQGQRRDGLRKQMSTDERATMPHTEHLPKKSRTRHARAPSCWEEYRIPVDQRFSAWASQRWSGPHWGWASHRWSGPGRAMSVRRVSRPLHGV